MSNITTEKKLDELYELIEDMQIAMMTTRRQDGSLVTRPMATQKQGPHADLWFVTNIETNKIDEIEYDQNVNIGYYDNGTKEWVSVSGTASLIQDRAKIRDLYEKDWKMWFEDEGGTRNGGPDDPRLALIFVNADTVHYSKAKYPVPVTLFKLVQSYMTGTQPDVARQENLSSVELN